MNQCEEVGNVHKKKNESVWQVYMNKGERVIEWVKVYVCVNMVSYPRRRPSVRLWICDRTRVPCELLPIGNINALL